MAHIQLLAGQTKHSDARATIEKDCYIFESLQKINGKKELTGNATYSIVPDQIEAGTFMVAAVASKGDILLKNCITKHLESITAKIIEVGGSVEDYGDSMRVYCKKRPTKANIKTLPYPGFPTDMQSQMGVILSIADGTSIINESITFVDEKF